MIRRWHTVVLVAALLPLPALAADAVEDDPYNLSLGAYFVTRTNGSIRLDRTAGVVTVGTSIDWERDLGGETSMTVPRIDGYYRFAPKHRVDFSWYKIERNGIIVHANATSISATSLFQSAPPSRASSTPKRPSSPTPIPSIATPRSKPRSRRVCTSPRWKRRCRAAGGALAESNSATAPLPVFGFRLDYAITPKWWMRGKYELFFLDSVQAYTGALSDFTISIEHRTFQHVGFGFGLNRSSLDLEVDDGSKQGAFSSVLNGLMVYAVLR